MNGNFRSSSPKPTLIMVEVSFMANFSGMVVPMPCR